MERPAMLKSTGVSSLHVLAHLLANTLYTLHSLNNSLFVHAMFTLLLPTLEFNSTESLYKRLQYSASSSARERSVMSHHTAQFRISSGTHLLLWNNISAIFMK
ncbi:unnamed protein product [Brassica napus]|uniref:(rape) hypothetical protein n=1 Tax=Brassica napus TaxID=3708 RepID=A0A817AXS5_BRANA|nr:unnamed protein product [Brassica napus]